MIVSHRYIFYNVVNTFINHTVIAQKHYNVENQNIFITLFFTVPISNVLSNYIQSVTPIYY